MQPAEPTSLSPAESASFDTPPSCPHHCCPHHCCLHRSCRRCPQASRCCTAFNAGCRNRTRPGGGIQAQNRELNEAGYIQPSSFIVHGAFQILVMCLTL